MEVPPSLAIGLDSEPTRPRHCGSLSLEPPPQTHLLRIASQFPGNRNCWQVAAPKRVPVSSPPPCGTLKSASRRDSIPASLEGASSHPSFAGDWLPTPDAGPSGHVCRAVWTWDVVGVMDGPQGGGGGPDAGSDRESLCLRSARARPAFLGEAPGEIRGTRSCTRAEGAPRCCSSSWMFV